MLSWDAAVQFGRVLERLTHVESEVSTIKAEVAMVKALVFRVALVATLWGGGLMLNLPADKVGEYTASFLRAMSK